jgi:hypothetical protein
MVGGELSQKLSCGGWMRPGILNTDFPVRCLSFPGWWNGLDDIRRAIEEEPEAIVAILRGIRIIDGDPYIFVALHCLPKVRWRTTFSDTAPQVFRGMKVIREIINRNDTWPFKIAGSTKMWNVWHRNGLIDVYFIMNAGSRWLIMVD